jgi:ribosomal protein S18 acetylase RimI-like enzyme
MSSVLIRNAREEDVDVAAEVLNEHSRRLYGTADITPAELREDWSAPEVEFPDNVLLAEIEGRLVGYADVIPRGDNAWLDVRGTDSRAYAPLLEAIARRADALGRNNVRGWAPEIDEDLYEAYERAGFRPFRHSFRMEIEVGGDLPAPEWPGGFSVRPFREGDERAAWEVQMDSFADTWGFTHEPFEAWAHWNLGEYFQPAHWFFVETGDEVAAVALCRERESESGLGWVNILGVRPAYRRRGLAIALLQHVFGHFAGRGLKTVGLGVDAENPTGAVWLYERAGMHVARRDIRFERVTG